MQGTTAMRLGITSSTLKHVHRVCLREAGHLALADPLRHYPAHDDDCSLHFEPCAVAQLQAALRPLLPPVLRSLGPLTTTVCKQLISTVESKYRDMAGSKEQAWLQRVASYSFAILCLICLFFCF